MAGEQVVESRADQHPGNGSVAYPAIEYQLEPGRALAVGLGAHPTRDLEKPAGAVEIALIDPAAQPDPGSLLASTLREPANDLDRAVQTGDRSHSIDTWHRDTGCTAGHRRGAFQPVQEFHPEAYDSGVAAFPLTQRPLVDSEGTIVGLESTAGSIEARRSGSLSQPTFRSPAGCQRSFGCRRPFLVGPIEWLVAAAISSQATLLQLNILAGPLLQRAGPSPPPSILQG